MAITTLDGVLAGMQPPVFIYKNNTVTTTAARFHSPFYAAGTPGAAAAPAPGIGGAALTTYAGQIPWTNPSSGNSYLARFSAASNKAGIIILADRLWHNSGIDVTSTGAQTINSATWPARDMNGATDGAGVQIGVEVSTAMGAGTPTFTMVYTNSGGTGSKSTVTQAMVASMAVGSFIPVPLAAGDTGVRSIQTWTQSATMTSGAYHLVAYRILAKVDIYSAGMGMAVDSLTGGFVRLYDNTVPFPLFLPAGAATYDLYGQLIVSQG